MFCVPCSLFCAGLCPGAQGNVDGMEFIVVYNPLFICVYGMGGGELIRMLERGRDTEKIKKHKAAGSQYHLASWSSWSPFVLRLFPLLSSSVG